MLSSMQQGDRDTLLLMSLLIFAGFLLFSPSFQLTGSVTSGNGTVSVIVEAANQTVPSQNFTDGGPGGGAAAGMELFYSPKDFTYDGSVRDVFVGTTLYGQLRLRNDGDLTHTFVVTSNKDFVHFTPDTFTIRPGETVVLSVSFTIEREGFNIAKLVLTSHYIEFQVPVLITTSSPDAPFSLMFEVPSAFKVVAPGGQVYSQLTLYGVERDNVEAEYSLRDAAGRVVLRQQERLWTTDGQRFERLTSIPPTLAEGTYVFGVVARYRNSHQSSATYIGVRQGAVPHVEFPSTPRTNPLPNVLIVLFFVISLTLVHVHYRKKFDR